MKKRLKKKAGNRYNVLKRAKRESRKRRGYKCIDYAIVPMGVKDRSGFDEEGYILEYAYATHWVAELIYNKDIYFIDEKMPCIIRVFPCNKNGGTHTKFPLQLIFYKIEEPKIIMSIFQKLVEDMKNDCFWNTVY